MLLHEKKVFVGTFVPRKEREKEMGEKVELYFFASKIWWYSYQILVAARLKTGSTCLRWKSSQTYMWRTLAKTCLTRNWRKSSPSLARSPRTSSWVPLQFFIFSHQLWLMVIKYEGERSGLWGEDGGWWRSRWWWRLQKQGLWLCVISGKLKRLHKALWCSREKVFKCDQELCFCNICWKLCLCRIVNLLRKLWRSWMGRRCLGRPFTWAGCPSPLFLLVRGWIFFLGSFFNERCVKTWAVRSKWSSIEDLVLMRTKLPKLSSFSPHFIQKSSSSPILIYLGTWKCVSLL